MPEVKPTKVFTKENPCSKVDIWNCFISAAGLNRVTVVASRSKIGLNTPKYLKRELYVTVETDKSVEYYELTFTGIEWLKKGLKRHLELHPEERAQVLHIAQLEGLPKRARVVRAAHKGA